MGSTESDSKRHGDSAAGWLEVRSSVVIYSSDYGVDAFDAMKGTLGEVER
jgi:hypothetical protein